MMQTAEHEIQRIQTIAETIRNDRPQRFSEGASPGDCWRQGDVYIELLPSVPNGAKPAKNAVSQLVPGSTRGSRHCLDSLDGVTIYILANPTNLDGPVLECRTERTIRHPEHGNVILPPGVYGITYQRDLDAEERERRVVD